MSDQYVITILKYVPRFREIEVYIETGVSLVEMHLMEGMTSHGKGVVIEKIMDDNQVKEVAGKEFVKDNKLSRGPVEMRSEGVENRINDHVHNEIDGVMYDIDVDASVVARKFSFIANLLHVIMDDPNINIEEYIRLEEEKARRRRKVFNWETATYGKIWDNEDVHDLGSVETEFPAIVFNDTLTSEAALSCEPTISSLNNNEIDFTISFDESDDEDCTSIVQSGDIATCLVKYVKFWEDWEVDRYGNANLGRYGVSVLALTKDHKRNEDQYAVSRGLNTPYSRYGINIIFWKISNVVPTPRNPQYAVSNTWIRPNSGEGLSDAALLDCFLSGLKEPLCQEVIAQTLNSLHKAGSLAYLFDENNSLAFINKPKASGFSSCFKIPINSYSPHAAQNPVAILRREKGLCFTCDEMYTWNHKCPNKQYMVLLTLSDDDDLSQVIDSLEVPTDNHQDDEVLDHRLSLNAHYGSSGSTVKEMTTNFRKLDKFKGHDFRRWQKKMHFLLTTLKVVYVLTALMLELLEDDTVEAIKRRAKWENDDYICRRHILNGMSDPLFDIYQNMESTKELWDSLKSKYMAKDASSKKFLVSNFNNYKMVDSRPVIEQFNELLRILGQYTQHGLKMDESISVSSVIDKFPPFWKDFKHSLKHGKDDLSLVQLGSHLRIEESLRAQESNKGKGKEVVGPSDNNGGFGSNNKSKLAYWKCGKTGHFKKDCRSGNKKDNASASGLGKRSKDQSQEQGQNLIDSGATTNVCKDHCWFKTYEPVKDGSILYMGDDHFALVHGKGSVVLEFSSGKSITLFNVLYVPKLRFGYYNNVMCMLNLNKVPDDSGFVYMSSSTVVNSSLWHARLGHVHYKRMLKMSKDDLIPIIDENLGKFNTCMLT
ncbi:zinc finger, CCHC-type containing protein [Tanacetum coccineum]|uniref:Zinc finger, CCHC-type containing protein n=1 Tax=Tanacetum coccineum TaxID=301880 RepID=A0ABQ5ASN0_9ASTR